MKARKSEIKSEEFVTISLRVPRKTKTVLSSEKNYTKWIASLIEANLGNCPSCGQRKKPSPK
jgi:hypothetical protein